MNRGQEGAAAFRPLNSARQRSKRLQPRAFRSRNLSTKLASHTLAKPLTPPLVSHCQCGGRAPKSAIIVRTTIMVDTVSAASTHVQKPMRL